MPRDVRWKSVVAELVLEAADLAAQRRLRDPDGARGATDVSLLGDGDEVADLGEAHRLSLADRARACPRRRAARSKRYWTERARPRRLGA